MASFSWTLHDIDGVALRSTESFASKEDAEDWMGREWSSLLAEGAESVSLVSDDGAVLYRMGLRAE
jgi:hypothetical protein